VIVDSAGRVGECWRRRWDSLRLFTPARYAALPGLAFPADPDHYPSKDEVADYLESYAAHFGLPVELGRRVERVVVGGAGYLIDAGSESWQARNVVLATGPYQLPSVPSFADALAPEVFQLHSSEYRDPDQLPDGPALVVGALASGCQIAEDLLARGRTVKLSVGSQPLLSPPHRILGRDVYWWGTKTHYIDLTIESRLGRWVSRQPPPAPGTSTRRVRRRGASLVARAVGASGTRVELADGSSLAVSNVVWATGYRSDYQWVEVDVFDDAGSLVQRRGVTAAPGLYVLGLSWQHSAGSALIGWVGRDADFLASHIEGRMRGAPIL
jgi:putative flavoprotein involved in K+ transport